MRALEFITGHMIYKPGLYLNLTDDNHIDQIWILSDLLIYFLTFQTRELCLFVLI